MTTVTTLERSGDSRWDAYVSAHQDATLYHTTRWRDFVAEVFGHTPVYYVAERDDVVCGVLPVFRVAMFGLGRKLISLPYDVGSGGALCDDEDAESALARAAVDDGIAWGARYVELRPGRERQGLEEVGFTRSEPVFISGTPLDRGGEAVWKSVAKDQRKAARKATNRGVVIRAGDGEADFDSFFEVYIRCFREFGTPPYDRAYFVELHRRLSPDGSVRLLLAEFEGGVIGGCVVFCFNGRWVSKFAAVLPEGRPLRAFSALYSSTLEAALAAGASHLSWGTSGPEQAGLIEFKERWGAETRPATTYSRGLTGEAPDLGRYYSSDGLPQRVWRKLPLGLTVRMGGLVNRWFC